MNFQFAPSLNVPINSLVISQSINVSGLDSPVDIYLGGAGGNTELAAGLTLANATLLVNGADVGTSAVVDNGDTVQVRCDAPSSYKTGAFAPVKFEGHCIAILGVMTELDPATTSLRTSMQNKTLTDYFNGYVASAPLNQFHRIDSEQNVLTTNMIVSTPVPSSLNDEQAYVFVADYVNNRVQRISPATGNVVQTMNVAGAFDVAHTPTKAPTQTKAHLLVSSATTNSVFVYDGGDYSLLETASTGAKPLGICGDETENSGDFGFWVCCYDSDRVEHWKYTNGVTLVRDYFYTLPSGAGPHSIALDDNGDAWVTCLKSNQVAKLPKGGSGAISLVNVAADPWSIFYHDGHMYVPCCYSSEVHVINTSSEISTTLSTIDNPTTAVVAHNHLYVGDFNRGTLVAYPLTTATEIGTAVPVANNRMLIGTTASDSTVFAATMYADNTIYVDVPNNTPSAIAFGSVLDAELETEYTSTVSTISGILDGPTTVFIPQVFDLALRKNGNAVSSPSTYANTDTLSLRVTTPDEPLSMNFPVLYDMGVHTWTITMTSHNPVRAAGWMRGG